MTVPESKDELLFVPLGGCGEIGMNLNLYGLDGKWLMVDLGVSFGDDRVPGVDVVMPDPAFIVERRADLLGLVLTHAHEDHLGAVPHLWRRLRCPVYASPFAAELLRRKLEEAGLGDAVDLEIVGDGDSFDLGPFNVTYHAITHSIPESHALAIRSRLGNILHTGDWKLDPEPMLGVATDPAPFTAFSREGVLAMVCDSTNVFVDGSSGSEAEVRESLGEIVARAPRRVAVATFASHIARLGTLFHVAAAADRHVALVGRSLWRAVQAARNTGYLDRDTVFVPERDAALLPPDKCMVVCTGCQGEPRAALSKIASRTHPHIAFEAGDLVVFSSKIIPGNERAIAVVQNRLVHDGVEVVTEQDAFVHVSGHPGRDELAELYRWVRPRVSVPVHGEARHLAEHARFARSLQVPEACVLENGSMLRLAPGPPEVVDRVAAGRLYLDGDRLIRADSEVARARRKLARAGSLAVAVVVGPAGALAAPPRFMVSGVVEDADGGGMIELLTAAAEAAIDRLPAADRRRDEDLEAAVRRGVGRSLRSAIGARPLIDVEIIRLSDDRGAGRANEAERGEVLST
ncbi:MAG: ribonuclease J [Alphaproteobacteria bacterium]|nr:ribonuclease J [Alphaproteobacteria bacterium]